MRTLYLRLALDNIRKGRRLYVPYMLTGQYNTHPRPAIQFTNEDRQDYSKFLNELYDIINS